jgi:AcrR family transcriptional regulator
MPRDGAEARGRLREAALALYGEHGYDATTTAQIAARAGVTERTYFRHFADKREVLFEGEKELGDVMTAAVVEAPADRPPLSAVQDAYNAAVPLFVAGRSVAERRAPIIAATPALQERAHAKSAAIVDAVADALVTRGVTRPTAELAAQVGRAAFARAMGSWGGRSAAELHRLIDEAMDEVRSLG